MSESEYMEKKTDIDSAALLELNENASPIDVDPQIIKKNKLHLPQTLKMKKPGNPGQSEPSQQPQSSSNDSD